MPPRRVIAPKPAPAAGQAARDKRDRVPDTTIDDIRHKRTQEHLAKERARQAVLEARGVFF